MGGQDFYIFLFLVSCIFFAWLIYRQMRHNPEAFSAQNLLKSSYTLAVLALLLIGFIGFCVWLLRSGI
jgi:hypothetical protein